MTEEVVEVTLTKASYFNPLLKRNRSSLVVQLHCTIVKFLQENSQILMIDQVIVL